ncbi:hypothetical protein [Phaeacidiphilus oryzae]|uniref:hypothetical protein n=1 Tax=Phaeacidiphilus oryzae TaxID=348818 RepID=UPI000562FE6D|nr:hypothetical protein [Phaeacidiphilus oryzae]
MPQGPGYSITYHGAIALLFLMALLFAGLVASPALRRGLGPDASFALLCLSAPAAFTCLAAWVTGHLF